MEGTDTGSAQQAPAPREPSFTERKAAQLREERARTAERDPQPEPARPERTPEPELESAAIEPVEDGYDEQDALDDEDDELEAPEGIPDNDSPDEDGEEHVNWKNRFEETRRKLSEVTENRQAMEQEHTDIMSTTLTLRHDLEDTLTEAKRYATQYKSAFDNQIAHLEQAFSTGQISPEHLPQARQQYQALVNQRNGLVQQVEQIGQQEAEAKRIERERKAEIARVRLSRTIPDWSREKHQELGEYARSRGYSPEEFNQSLDYRFLELLNDSMQLRSAASTVRSVKRRKKGGGPKRNAEVPARGTDGKFRKAKADFHNNPNQKGRFAEMKFRQLQKDRQR